MRRLRRRTREGCGFSSLVKQNKKAKICFVIHIAGEKKILFYIYFVIVNGPLITTCVCERERERERESVCV